MHSDPYKSERIDLRTIISLISSKWYIFAAAIGLCVMVAVIYVVLAVPVYHTTASILVRSDDSFNPMKSMNLSGAAADLMKGSKEIDDEIEIVRSKTLTRQMIEQLNLYTDVYLKQGLTYRMQYESEPLKILYSEDFRKKIAGKMTVEVNKRGANDFRVKFAYKTGAGTTRFSKDVNTVDQPIETPWGVVSFVERSKGWSSSDEEAKLKYVTLPLKARLEQYSGSLNVFATNNNSNVIVLDISSQNPTKSEAILNTIIDLYNQDALMDKNRASMQMADFIKERLALITTELTDVEQNVETYRKKNNLADISEQAKLAIGSSSEYDNRIVEVEIQKNLVDFVGSYLATADYKAMIPGNTGVKDEGLAAMFLAYNELVMQYQRIAQVSTDENPALIRLQQQIQLQRDNIRQTIASVRKGLDITQRDLKAKNSQFNAMIDRVPTIEREFVSIARQQQIKQELYLFLLQKREETEMLLSAATVSAKTVDNAYTDEAPVSPRRMITVIFAVFLGFLIAGFWTYLSHILNNKIQNRDEVKMATSTTIVGEIPMVATTDHVVVKPGVHSVINERFKMIRANLRFILKSKEEKVILVTSSVSGEGKTFFALNFALAMAQTGKRVIILGLDIRSPRMAEYIGVKNTPGVTDFISNQTLQVEDVILPSAIDKCLSVIPAGTIPPNPAELLDDERLNLLFEQLRATYDYIIVDSAPVTFVADTLLLNRLADAVFYVCRVKVTERDYIATNLNQLIQEGKLTNVSLVINGVPEKALKAYGYKNYSGQGSKKN